MPVGEATRAAARYGPAMKLSKLLPATLLLTACAVDAAPDEPEATATDEAALSATPQLTAIPTFKAVMTTTNGLSVMKPTGTVSGDFLLAFAEYDATPMQLTPPAGWTLVADQLSGSGTPQVMHAVVFSHRAGASEPDEFMFNAPSGVFVDLQVASYTGVTAVDGHSGEGVRTGTILAPDLVTVAANELLVSLFVDFEFGSWSTSAGMTQRTNFDANSIQDVRIPLAGHTEKHLASCTFGQQAAVNVTLR